MKRLCGILSVIMLFAVSVNAQRQLGQTKTLNVNKNFERSEGNLTDVNGIQMYYEEYGEGDPVLVIHGNGGSVEDVMPQVQFLSKRFRVIAADSRGQGQTTNNADSLTYEMMALDLKLLLDDLGLDSVYILGFSDGGIIGLLMAIHYPEKVGKLICMSANLSPDTTALVPELVNQLNIQKGMLMDSIKAGKDEYSDDLMLIRLMLNHPDIDPEMLHLIEAPVLIMSGDRDLVQLEHTVMIFRNIPGAQLSIFPGTTHNAAAESPQTFNNQVMRFFFKKKARATTTDEPDE